MVYGCEYLDSRSKSIASEAMPALVSGITVTAIALVGSTAIAGVIGAGGLGNLLNLT